MANNLQKTLGGTGCDIVTSESGDFTARRGRIYAIIVRENNTQIASIVEDKNGAQTKISGTASRSWLGIDTGASSGGDSDEGIPTLLKDELIIPDYPLTQIHLVTGSVMVYYDEYSWKHYRR